MRIRFVTNSLLICNDVVFCVGGCDILSGILSGILKGGCDISSDILSDILKGGCDILSDIRVIF